MKRRLKKNQVVVTALAVMVAVAGYLNYSGMEFGKETATLGKVQEGAADEGAVSTSLIDIPSLDEDVSVEETGEISAASDGVEAETGDGAGTGDTPGEAVLTSVTAGSSFAAEAKLTREQVRAKNKETLLEVINNNSISEDQKQYAVDSMNAMVDGAEREASAELLLDSKGFLDAVVSISDGTADVVINQAEISEAERAQIEDIVKRKTNISGENIIITPRLS